MAFPDIASVPACYLRTVVKTIVAIVGSILHEDVPFKAFYDSNCLYPLTTYSTFNSSLAKAAYPKFLYKNSIILYIIVISPLVTFSLNRKYPCTSYFSYERFSNLLIWMLFSTFLQLCNIFFWDMVTFIPNESTSYIYTKGITVLAILLLG